ncbi:MAG: hypothetical protein ACI8RZ_001137 [Myxococcota bacterium]|jgi:hypothetical protein
MLWLLLACGKPATPSLPPIDAMASDRLAIVLHGYISSGEEISALVDGLARDPDAPIHTHNFDFGRFSRVGHSHNADITQLSAAFTSFYDALPQHCPVCADRADAPVEVTIVARSLGGVVVRESLLDGLIEHRQPWRISQVVTLSAPFSGSMMTRFSTGFLSIVLNGLVRTVLFGFINPERGGNFGRVVDVQIRAVRMGSPYLWSTHHRWAEHLKSAEVPDWLAIVGIGHGIPEREGDGVVRFPSSNFAPLFPDANIETMLLDVTHPELFNRPRSGREGRELAVALSAIRQFMERGTLAGHPDLVFRPLSDTLPQKVYEPTTGPASDVAHRARQIGRILDSDAGDLWMRFYAERPGYAPQEIVLERHLSAFQEGQESSWQELEPQMERAADGTLVPTTLAVIPTPSQLIHIPDIAPSGWWGLQVRLAGGIVVDPSLITVTRMGAAITGAPQVDGDRSPVPIAPLQANLLRVSLDELAIRARHPELERLVITELSLEPLSSEPADCDAGDKLVTEESCASRLCP